MAQILGIDTSNYTTSAALLDLETGEVHQEKQLLPVKVGEVGLRQSDAVFHHTRQLPELLERLRRFWRIIRSAASVFPHVPGMWTVRICPAF